MKERILYIVLTLILTVSCTNRPVGKDSGITPDIYPDFTDITVPSNIAPLNFLIEDKADKYLTLFEAGNRRIQIRGRKVCIPIRKWRSLTVQGDIKITVYQILGQDGAGDAAQQEARRSGSGSAAGPHEGEGEHRAREGGAANGDESGGEDGREVRAEGGTGGGAEGVGGGEGVAEEGLVDAPRHGEDAADAEGAEEARDAVGPEEAGGTGVDGRRDEKTDENQYKTT